MATGSSNITVDMGKLVGEGFLKGGGVGSYRTSQLAQAFFKDGKLFTIFPKLGP